jgi:hypothetical protein
VKMVMVDQPSPSHLPTRTTVPAAQRHGAAVKAVIYGAALRLLTLSGATALVR